MNYNFIETEDLYKTILDLNHLNESDLYGQYDFAVDDEVFLNFKEKLLARKDKRFLIVGDYDCDGICATTIVRRLLEYLHISCNHYIPSRLKEGYGLNDSIIHKAIDNHFDCLIVVDNGITALKQLELAKANGLEVFIIDHHEYEVLPDCEAIIHSETVTPKFRNLSAGGLSFILSRLFYEDELSLILGGLSTISDIMSVIGFNRYLISEMVKHVNNSEALKLLNDGKRIEYRDLSFNIIPKINAVSRMEPEGNPNYLVRFFLDSEFAKKFAPTISYLNEQRKISTRQMATLAYRMIDPAKKIILIVSKEFREGLCGLIANRLLHELGKPVIVLSRNPDGELKGSGRAPEGINLYELIKAFSEFRAFGGHEAAVGLTLAEDKLPEFSAYLESLTINNDYRKDVILLDKADLNEKTLSLIESLRPFGTGLGEPLLGFKNEDYQKIIVSRRFPKYIISAKLSAISFNETYKNVQAGIFIGHLERDSYRAGSLSFKIDEIVAKGI